MQIILKNLPEDQIQLFSAVLSSVKIEYELYFGDRGWDIWVSDDDFEPAYDTISLYFQENKPFQNFYPELHQNSPKTLTGFWIAAILFAVYLSMEVNNNSSVIIENFGASAFHITKGEIFRAVTALALHSDVLHILGNMAGIALFGTFVCRLAGVGVGWLIILISGVMGNILNAFWYQNNHLSIGASTSVFGAVGILCAIKLVRSKDLLTRKKNIILSLGAGLALLGLLGTGGERVDILAHLFGFVSGVVIGFLFLFFEEFLSNQKYQTGSILLIIGIQVLSWLKILKI